MEFLIVCPLVFLAGFVDAIAGGGGLIALPAYMIAGLPVHTAIGTNKLSSGMGTAVSTWQFGVKGYIPKKEACIGIVLALAGSWLGAKVALLIEDDIFRMIMLIILPLTAIYVMFNKSMEKERNEQTDIFVKTQIYVGAVAFVIGIYDGFYGPGTGTFLMLLLTGVAKLSLQNAAGVTKAINLTTNVTALAVYFMSGNVIFLLGLAAGCFSVLGNVIGVHCFAKSGVKLVKPIMILVLVLFFIKTIFA